MQINFIIERLMIYFQVDRKKDLSEKLGIQPSVLSNWLNRNSIDWDIIFTKCENINYDWLIRGKGPMVANYDNQGKDVVSESIIEYSNHNITKQELIGALESAIKSLRGEL